MRDSQSKTARHLKHSMPALLIGLMVLAVCQFAGAQQPQEDVNTTWSLVLENDMFLIDDGGYTNGMMLSWSRGDFSNFSAHIPSWMDWLSRDLYIATMPDKERRISYSITQEIYTSEEIVIRELQPLDRPYAGLLTWRADWLAFDERQADQLSLELGVVGPAALGKQSQKLVHQLTGANKPVGWAEQLKNEPIFRIGAERSWRFAEGKVGNLEYDAIGHALLSAGTRRSNLGGGFSVRLGRKLQTSFAGTSAFTARNVHLNAHHRGAWYAFLSIAGDYVFNDITLNGNTYRNSHSVDLEHWQTNIAIGAAFNLGRWGFLLSLRSISDEFETQLKDSRYGSIAISYDFAAP